MLLDRTVIEKEQWYAFVIKLLSSVQLRKLLLNVVVEQIIECHACGC